MIAKHSWLWTGGLIALIAYVLGLREPGLLDDDKSAFAFLAGFVSIYGVVLAILEAFKAKTAAQQALAESKKVSSKINSLYSLRDAAECQICIENALRIADEEGPIPLAILSRITKLYASEFAQGATAQGTVQHDHLLMVESYGALAPKQRAKSTKIRSILLGMGAQLAARGSEHIASESIQ
jgi:hypothetical protein